MTSEARAHQMTLRNFAMSYPEAHEAFPWGERVIKVKGKTFVFLSTNAGVLSCATKLPRSRAAALKLPFASPTEYGLGKSGWVTAQFAPDELVPIDLLGGWIDESYHAIAPKKLVAELEGGTDAKAKPKFKRVPPKRS